MTDIQITRTEVRANTRRLGRRITIHLRGKKHNYFKPLMWRMDNVQDLESHHSIDVEEELMRILSEEINAELRASGIETSDERIIRMITELLYKDETS
jgi:hypothetical protein